MAESNQKSNATKKKQRKALVIIVISAAVAAIWWQHSDRFAASSSNTKVQPTSPAIAEKKRSQGITDKKGPDNKKVAEAKEKALAQLTVAAKSVPTAKPVEGPVTRRPEFIAEFEWKVIQELAGQNPDVEKREIELVNKLLFFKKWEAWRNLLNDDEQAIERHGLAKDILKMMPAQMEILGLPQAREMKAKLLTDLNGKS